MPGRRALVAAMLAAVLLAIGGAARADEASVVSAHLTATPTAAVVEMTIAPGWHVNSATPRDEFLIPTSLAVTPPAGVHAGPVAYPPPVERRLAFGGGKTFLLYEGTVSLTVPLEGSGTGPVRAALRYQACDDTRCLPPRTLDLQADRPSPVASSGPAGGGNPVAGWVTRWGWPLTFVWVVLLGVALNLTPCVYPLISVTVAFFGGRTAGNDGGAIRRALVYVLGICLSFSTVGVLAAFTGSLFGAALQRPPVLAGIAGVCVALAASNFGLYQLRMPGALVQRLGRGGEGHLGALFMGLTMGLVAAPCIGPIVVALLVFVGSQQSVPLGFALFFALGLGLGAPYVALAALAGRLRRLPRSGPWLAWVEHVFGFLLLGLALWFAAPLLPPVATRVLAGVLLVAGAVWLGFLGPRTGPGLRLARRVGAVAVLAVAVAGLPGADTAAGIAWQPFSDAALARAAAAGRPVLLDFQADWCVPCREMEHTTFRDPDVVRMAAEFEALRVDVTAGDDAATALMGRWRVLGVPTYVILGAGGEERTRLVGFVPAERMLVALRSALGARGV
jgi:thiol:disulfide interchange protein DsbD